jgi:hypothetical protein
MGARLFQAGRQTAMTKLMGVFAIFAHAPNNNSSNHRNDTNQTNPVRNFSALGNILYISTCNVWKL